MNPAMRMTKQSHHTGLKENICAKATNAPARPPMAAMCDDIFHFRLMTVQSTSMTIAATSTLPTEWGIWNRLTT